MEHGKTAHNRTVSARPFGAGLRKTAVGLAPFVRFFSATFFCARETLRVSFIGRKKTSDTAGTLCDIFGKLL
jgi:hypothetical protein